MSAEHAPPQGYALLLRQIMHRMHRRYRVPVVPEQPAQGSQAPGHYPATRAALAVETARTCLEDGHSPSEATRQAFVQALAQMIEQALHPEEGDAAFQAMLLQYQHPLLREYASLAAQADHDQRQLHSAVNTIAHPEKQQRAASAGLARALGELHRAAAAGSWQALQHHARELLDLPEPASDALLARGVHRILEEPALARLQRLEILKGMALVQQFQALRDRNGPRSGSADAAAQGSASRKRGAEVEALAAQAVAQLARRLEAAEQGARYEVVSSLRSPASLIGDSQRGKGEWDVVLLHKVNSGDGKPQGPAADSDLWDIGLLVEAKSSVDAATTDLPRLVRGLNLLTQADEHCVYAFKAGPQVYQLRGASLKNLGRVALEDIVLYCCDAPAETAARLLSPASRMQLLSAEASLAYADKLSRGEDVSADTLNEVWDQLLTSPPWRPVLQQYQSLRRVRELMVHPDDLVRAL